MKLANPYAPPAVASSMELSRSQASDEDERVRRENVEHEVRMQLFAPSLFLLAAGITWWVVRLNPTIAGDMGLAVVAGGALVGGAIGWGLWRLNRLARAAATVLSVVGTVNHFVVSGGFVAPHADPTFSGALCIPLLCVLFSAKAVFSAEYAGVIARTPHIKPQSRWLPFVGFVALAVGADFFPDELLMPLVGWMEAALRWVVMFWI